MITRFNIDILGIIAPIICFVLSKFQKHKHVIVDAFIWTCFFSFLCCLLCYINVYSDQTIINSDYMLYAVLISLSSMLLCLCCRFNCSNTLKLLDAILLLLCSSLCIVCTNSLWSVLVLSTVNVVVIAYFLHKHINKICLIFNALIIIALIIAYYVCYNVFAVLCLTTLLMITNLLTPIYLCNKKINNFNFMLSAGSLIFHTFMIHNVMIYTYIMNKISWNIIYTYNNVVIYIITAILAYCSIYSVFCKDIIKRFIYIAIINHCYMLNYMLHRYNCNMDIKFCIQLIFSNMLLFLCANILNIAKIKSSNIIYGFNIFVIAVNIYNMLCVDRLLNNELKCYFNCVVSALVIVSLLQSQHKYIVMKTRMSRYP